MIDPNDPSLTSWVPVPENSDFPIQNLPFGIFKKEGEQPRTGVAIGEQVLDLSILFEYGLFDGLKLPGANVFHHRYLNPFMALGKSMTSKIRQRLSELLNANSSELRDNVQLKSKALVQQSEVELLLPLQVGDYTDFYSSEQHARNVGSMFRDPDNALLPNWKHIPVGYHGRASSIIVSGAPVHRPKGQTRGADQSQPRFGPSKKLDFELEMAFVTCAETSLGESIPVGRAMDHIFGMVIFNDWSARDIQAWEYVPLGPFLGKNFASSISPWVVTMEALHPFKVKGPSQHPEVLGYLQDSEKHHYDIQLEVVLKTKQGSETQICTSNYKHLYWNMAQQLAHHTANGCNIRVGDMYASGTISGTDSTAFGSLLELTWNGKNPLTLSSGEKRSFLEDGDTVIMRAFAKNESVRIGFGEVRAEILSATT